MAFVWVVCNMCVCVFFRFRKQTKKIVRPTMSHVRSQDEIDESNYQHLVNLLHVIEHHERQFVRVESNRIHQHQIHRIKRENEYQCYTSNQHSGGRKDREKHHRRKRFPRRDKVSHVVVHDDKNISYHVRRAPHDTTVAIPSSATILPSFDLESLKQLNEIFRQKNMQ